MTFFKIGKYFGLLNAIDGILNFERIYNNNNNKIMQMLFSYEIKEKLNVKIYIFQ